MPRYTFTHHQRTRVVVDLAGQILSADIDPQVDWSQLRREPPIDPPPTDGGIAVHGAGHAFSSSLHASVAASGVDARFTPLFALTAKAKRFDDRLVASVEKLTHHGAGESAGLFDVFARIRDELAPGTRVRGLFEAAHHRARGTFPELGPANLHARKWLAAFMRDAKRSKPVGAYAETEELQRIFQHDRLLQSELTPEDAARIRSVLEANPELATRYRQHLALNAKLTGPAVLPSVDYPAGEEAYAVLPASDSAERRLVEKLFGQESPPLDFELGRELVARIRDGRLRTAPESDAGWYAHQFHAIAALLSPETEGLLIGPRYRAELEDAFKALFALNRETHVKQLESAIAGGAPPLYVFPRVSVEPLPESYARTASSYRYLREQLMALFGDHVLRSTELADTGADVVSGLVEMEMLFRGAEIVSRFELAQAQAESAEATMARAVFQAWRRSGDDPDLAYDLRVAVPVWFDVTRRTVRICATIGLETRTLKLDFVQRPNVKVYGDDAEPRFAPSARTILSAITIECDVRETPTREQLRAICEREKTPAAIKAALETGQGAE